MFVEAWGGASRVPSRDELLRLLKDAADVIRTAVDYTVILLFLFYKAISDKWEVRVSEYKAQGLSEVDARLLANEDYINSMMSRGTSY